MKLIIWLFILIAFIVFIFQNYITNDPFAWLVMYIIIIIMMILSGEIINKLEDKKQQQEKQKAREQQRQQDLWKQEQVAVQYNYVVYAIINYRNKMVYVGMTSNFERRKSEHFSSDYRNKQRKLLYKYMEQLGPSNFIMIPIFETNDRRDALYAEARLIKNWGTIYPYGYNVNEELDNRQLGYNVASYNRPFFDLVNSYANMKNKHNLIKTKRV